MTVIGFTGYAQSGKDTAAGFLVEEFGFIRFAFADILRTSLYALNPIAYFDGQTQGNAGQGDIRVQDIVDLYGWDIAKTHYPEIRQLLQRFGTEVGRDLYGENFWVERITSQIKPGGDYVITDVRFPNEERAVHDLGGKVIKIARVGNRPANTHASEDIERLLVDVVVPNNGSMDDFRIAVLDAVGVYENGCMSVAEENRVTRLEVAGVPYALTVGIPLEFGFIVDGAVLTPYEFACYDASCRPPTSGGTGGSRAKGGAGGAASRPEDLDLLFPGRRSTGGKAVYDDGTFSVEGLNEDGSFKVFKDKTEATLQAQWDGIGPKREQYVDNMVIAGQLAMGIDPATGKVDGKQAAKGLEDSKWYSKAHDDCQAISDKTGIELDAVIAATTTLSAGRLWSGTKNGNIETARALADIVKNPIDIEVSQQHIDLMNWRREKSTKGVGKTGLDTDGLKPGKINSKDLDSATLVEVMYAVNTMRGHPSLADWMSKTTKDGKPGMKSSKEQTKTDPPYPYFTSKGTQQVKQAVAVLRGEVTPRQAISGPKYSSFYSNIANPNKDYSSTNDTWHYRIMAGNLPLTYERKGNNVTRPIVEHSLKDRSPDGMIVTTQDIFQRAASSKPEGLSGGDGMFRDTTAITRTALDTLKTQHPKEFGNMKIHEFQALIWVHYGGGQTSDAGRTAAWFGALDKMA